MGEERTLFGESDDEPASLENFQSGIQVHLNPSLLVDSARRLLDPVFVVSVVFLEQLGERVREHHNAAQPPADYQVNSHLVTVSLECERGTDKAVVYQSADMFSIDKEFIISIEFTFLNASFNRTLRTVECAEIPSGGFPNLQPTQNCRLRYTNRTGVSLPTCDCLRTGTYGLVISRPPSDTGRVHISGVSRPVVYGCMISLILSALTWAILIRSYSNSSAQLITGLKVI